MKKIVLLFAFLSSTFLLVSQEALWVKNSVNSAFKITQVIHDNNTLNILYNNSLNSNLQNLDTTTNQVSSFGFSREHNYLFRKGSSAYLSFTEDNFTGVNKVDDTGTITAENYFTDKSARDPKIFNWNKNRILVLDNYEYKTDQTFPRVTLLDTFLRIDTSFFIPLDLGDHIYSDAVVSSDGSLFITGGKNEANTGLDQYLIRIDNTLQLESSRTFGSTTNDWIEANRQSIVNFPGGVIIAGQSIANRDTTVSLSVVSPDNISFSHHIISSNTSTNTFTEGTAYLNSTQTIYLLVEKEGTSHLLLFNLDGSLTKTYEISNGLNYHKIILQDNLIYLYGNESVACLDPLKAHNTGSCLLSTVSIFTTKDVSSQWLPKPYLVSPVGLDLKPTSINTETVSFSNFLRTSCPEISLIGSIKGCNQDTLCVSATGESIKWFESNRIDSLIATENTFCFTPDENKNYTVMGDFGSSFSFTPEIDKDPSCIPDTIPIVYDYVSPNNDGENDQFFIKNISFIKPVSLRVVNAQNEEVFSDSDYSNNWSPNLPDGTYFFSVTGSNFQKQGTLIIRR